LIPDVAGYLVWDGGQLRDSVSSARVNPAPNGYLGKSGEGKQETRTKEQDGWSPNLHLVLSLDSHKTTISTAGLNTDGLVPSYLLTYFLIPGNSFVTFYACDVGAGGDSALTIEDNGPFSMRNKIK